LTVLSLQDDGSSPVTAALQAAGARVVFLPARAWSMRPASAAW